MALSDTIIIGAGPAGMTAAIYARRKGMSVTLLADSIGGQMTKTGDIENYPGYEMISGSDLAKKMKAQMKRLGLEPAIERVSGVERIKDGFMVTTQGGRSYVASTVIVASGSHWREIGVPGEKEFISKGVSYCTTCDGPLFADMDVAVVGGGNSAAESVLEMTHMASKVYMIVRSRLKCDQVTTVKIRQNDKVKVLEGYAVEKISGKDFVESITVKSTDGKTEDISVGGVFVEIGLDPNTAFIKGLVKTNDRGEIEVDRYCSTSVEGLFACGDVTNVPLKQVIIAAGEGAKAAMGAFMYLSKNRDKEASTCPAPKV